MGVTFNEDTFQSNMKEKIFTWDMAYVVNLLGMALF